MVEREVKLLREGDFIVVFFPAFNTAHVFRVVDVTNAEFTTLEYGYIPIKSGTTLINYVTGERVTVPADGVLPAYSYIPPKYDITFPADSPPLSRSWRDRVYDNSDIWYLSENARDRLFHVHMFIYPPIIRVYPAFPKGRDVQFYFQRGNVPLEVYDDTGFSRGYFEWVSIPGIHWGWRFLNPLNIAVKTYVKFIFGEYRIEPIDDVELIFNILTREVKAYWVKVPLYVEDVTVRTALERVWGSVGFKLYPKYMKEQALREYEGILKVLRERFGR